jgi:hypothetical protein
MLLKKKIWRGGPIKVEKDLVLIPFCQKRTFTVISKHYKHCKSMAFNLVRFPVGYKTIYKCCFFSFGYFL